jgi:serine/threonine protein kinase
LPLQCIEEGIVRLRENGFREQLPGYEIGETLGAGTTSVVKKGFCCKSECSVAVKCIKTPDEELQQFARDEYDILKKLQHEYIVKVELLHVDSCHVWMVMELCEDGNLQSYCERHGPFSEPHTLELFEQLLLAIHHMHSKRFCHRDLKPENCLLKENAYILKVADFNSAKEIGQGEGSSIMLSERGTKSYAAPELLLGGVWNERVDVWACGMILYFMLNARVPFDVLERCVKESFLEGRLPRHVDWANFSPPVFDLELQCLKVDMQDRPAPMNILQHPVFLREDGEHKRNWINRFFLSWCECQTRSKMPPRSMSM